jgi:hypothetical protein
MRHDAEHPNEFTSTGKFCYWFTNIVTLPICIALIGLTMSILWNLFDNMTTIETMGLKGHKERRCPCCGVFGFEGYHKPNTYDMLWPNNLA